MGAPAGVSQDLQQFTRFLPSNGGNGIRIHSCFALASILRISSDAQGAGLRDGTGGSTGISMQLSATDPALLAAGGTKSSADFVSPIFDLIASAFVRYRVTRLVFHYEPQSSATTSERMVFAFAADPLHPILWNSTVPNQTSLLAVADSVAFAPWRAWSMDVTYRLGNTFLYTFADSSTTVGTFTERFNDFGVISCITSSVSGSTADCGILYGEIEVEFEEFCPISVTRPAMASYLAPRLANHVNVKVGKPKEKTDDGETPILTDLEVLEQYRLGKLTA